MAFPELQKKEFFTGFAAQNRGQMRAKSRQFKMELDEIVSCLFVLVSDRLDDFDPSKGSAEAFFFGLLHAQQTRYLRDACSNAMTLDDESPAGLAFSEAVSYTISTASNEPCFTNTSRAGRPVGTSSLLALADAASGKSARQIGNDLKVSRRRINQILKQKREEAAVQRSFDF
jgi:hypothetical protein